MTEPPERIGICPNRLGEARYVVAGVFLNGDDKQRTCEHCGEPLLIYVRESAESRSPAG